MAEQKKDWLAGSSPVDERHGAQVMLIVDDVPLNRQILAEYFRGAYSIVEADNGQTAYQYIEEHCENIAVIMLDLVMPVMDGVQLMKLLRDTPRFASIPVVVTSQSGDTSEAQAFSLGASDFLAKPYNMDIAVHRVQNVTARNTVQTLEREKRMLSKMQQMATEAKLDPMTGIYNRMEMERQVQNFFTEDQNHSAVFFMLDIDNFKSINDVYGHGRGDEALKQAARVLKTLFREEDAICRMGGDEFSVFMRAKLTQEQLVHRLDKMREKLNFQVENTSVSCSIGACVTPEHGDSYQTVYDNADLALLTAKRLGKNRWHIYGGEDILPEQVLHRNMEWLLDESSDAIVVCDAKSHKLYYVNDVACLMAGKDRKTCLSMPCYRAVWGKDAPCSYCVPVNKMTDDYIEQEIQPENSESCYIVKSKLFLWDGREARVHYIQDNTKRFQLNQEISALAADRQTLLDLLPGGLFRYNADTQEFNFVSENMLHMLGYTRAQFDEKFKNRFDLMVWQEDRERVLNEIKKQISASDYDTCEYRIEKNDGTLCWVYDTGYLHTDRTGKEFYVIVTDNSELKEMEQQNKLLLENIASLADNVPGALCLYLWDGHHLDTLAGSSQLGKIFGISQEQARENTQRLLSDHVHPKDLTRLRTTVRMLLDQGVPVDCMFRVFHEAKQEYTWLRMQTTSKLQPDHKRRIYALYTEQTQQQKSIMETEK